MPAGPSRRLRISCQAYATSLASAGRTTVEPGDGAERRELLDRLVRRAVLAERDGVVRPDEDRRHLHERRETHRRAHVVAEDEERAAERARLAVQHDAVHDRGHRVLADAEVQHAAVGVARRLVGGPLGGDERGGVVDRREVRLGEVGRAAPELGEHAGEGVDDLAGCGAGRDLGAALERRAAPTSTPSGSSPASSSGRAAPCARGWPRPRRRTRPATRRAARRRARRASRVCSMTSSATTKVCSGSKPSTSLMAASSSAPRAEPWILPVFCLLGARPADDRLQDDDRRLRRLALGGLDGARAARRRPRRTRRSSSSRRSARASRRPRSAWRRLR